MRAPKCLRLGARLAPSKMNLIFTPGKGILERRQLRKVDWKANAKSASIYFQCMVVKVRGTHLSPSHTAVNHKVSL